MSQPLVTPTHTLPHDNSSPAIWYRYLYQLSKKVSSIFKEIQNLQFYVRNLHSLDTTFTHGAQVLAQRGKKISTLPFTREESRQKQTIARREGMAPTMTAKGRSDEVRP